MSHFIILIFCIMIPFFHEQQTLATEIAFEHDASLPIVYLNVVIKGGSVNDPVHQSGLSNFMAEMLLRGTQTKTKEQIDLTLDQMGAQLDIESRTEALIFRAAVLSSQLHPFLELLTEILTQPRFSEDEIKKLKSEVISGIQEELGHDESLASLKFNQFLFQNHPYGNAVLGRSEDIKNLNSKMIWDHYKKLVRNELLLIVGTGDADTSQISNWKHEFIPLLPHTPIPDENKKILEKISTPENAAHRRLLIVDKPDRTQTQIKMGQIGIQMTDPDFFPLHLGNHAFGGPSFSATLMQEIRVQRGWSYGASSGFKFGIQPRSWSIYLFPASKDSAPALELTLKLLENLKTHGITQNQFEFSKRSMINKSGFMYNTPKKRAENILLEKTLDLPTGFIKSYATTLKEVQLPQVNHALEVFLKPDCLAITILGTAKNLKTSLAKAAGIPEKEIQVTDYTKEE